MKFFDAQGPKEGRRQLVDADDLKGPDTRWTRRRSETPGVSYIVAIDKKTGEETRQSVRFDLKKFTEDQARAWYEAQGKNESKEDGDGGAWYIIAAIAIVAAIVGAASLYWRARK